MFGKLKIFTNVLKHNKQKKPAQQCNDSVGG